eukprot:1178528-Prorocentrum_minimum.AAC.4
MDPPRRSQSRGLYRVVRESRKRFHREATSLVAATERGDGRYGSRADAGWGARTPLNPIHPPAPCRAGGWVNRFVEPPHIPPLKDRKSGPVSHPPSSPPDVVIVRKSSAARGAVVAAGVESTVQYSTVQHSTVQYSGRRALRAPQLRVERLSTPL